MYVSCSVSVTSSHMHVGHRLRWYAITEYRPLVLAVAFSATNFVGASFQLDFQTLR